jgi:hypothetical protein
VINADQEPVQNNRLVCSGIPDAIGGTENEKRPQMEELKWQVNIS